MNVGISMYGVRLGCLSAIYKASSGFFPALEHRIWHHGQFTMCYSKKAKKSSAKTVELVEGERDVVNLEKVEGSMSAAVQALKHEFTTSITTRITPASLEKVSVEIEGQSYPLKQVAQLGMPNPQTILINMSAYPESVSSVTKAIHKADLNLNPLVEKNLIKIPLPKLTGELRESLVKLAKSHAEKAKVGVRKARQKGMVDLKKAKSAVSEDTIHRLEKYLQQVSDQHTTSIDSLLAAKSDELTKS